MHLFGLFVFALTVQYRCQIVHARQRIRMLLTQHLLCFSEMKHLHLVRLGPPSYPEQEAFHSIDHGESIHRKLVQRFMQGTKHTKASHHMRHQPELMARVDLILGDGIRHKLQSEAAQLSLAIRLQSILSLCMYELVHCIALLIRFPLNQRITLKRLERRFKLTYCPLLLREEERLPGQCCGL